MWLWSGRRYYLDKMTLSELISAYATYPAIETYAALFVVGACVTAALAQTYLALVAAVLATGFAYPLIWYGLHRIVLHGRFLYRIRQTASVWRRIHFDHHQDPNDLRVLIGARCTTLPTVVIFTGPIGYFIDGLPGATAAVSMGLFATCIYEFCRCIQHFRFTPRTRWLENMKKRHLAHHFHREKGNYGITNFFWGRALGTYYPDPESFPASNTVHNLGYAGNELVCYPWVADLSGIIPEAGRGAEQIRDGAAPP
ncbi:MAG: sterol desaturase family protein [Alphaproteobacteria bacterium]|nr:sterol desaturase family protein [Alphaproteobacteria bacterium]